MRRVSPAEVSDDDDDDNEGRMKVSHLTLRPQAQESTSEYS